MSIKLNEITIVDGALPIVKKTAGFPAYVFDPTGAVTEVQTETEAFFVPYYKVKRSEALAWLHKLETNPPNPLATYEGVILTYSEGLGGEPLYGAGFYRVSRAVN